MSEFSDLLSSYIEEKEIKVYALLEYCSLDRSTMYKIINGKRNPTSEAVFALQHICLWMEMISAVLFTVKHQVMYFSRRHVWCHLLTGGS